METRTIICLLACVFGIAQVTNASEGALRGKFAISATDTVAFSRGNLQYRPSTDTWRLAENQWEFVGTANGRIRSYQYSSEGWVWTYEGWLDLFGWGTGNNPTASSAKNSNYGTYSEWGNNAIQNGGNARNLWRTLSKEEWNYLYSGRTNAASLYANGTVNGVKGSILLPENWVIPAGLSFKASNNTDSTVAANDYTADEWVLMEMAGAVFLPITYERTSDWQQPDYCTAVYAQNTARYWTSTANGSNGAYYYAVYGTPNNLPDNRYVGKAVRLIQKHDGSELFPVMAGANSALFRWQSMPNAESYTLHVYGDSAKKEEVFYITFDRDGVVEGLHFVSHAPSRTRANEYTEKQFFYTLKGLRANTDYWYSISGEDSEGQILQTTEGRFKTEAVEARADGVTVNPAESSAVFMWPTDSAAGSYQIDIYKDGAVFCHLTLGPTGTLAGISFLESHAGRAPQGTSDELPSSLSFEVTGLDEATRYNYVLSVLDASKTPLHVYTGAFATVGYPGELTEGGDEVIPTPPIIPSNPEASITTGTGNTATSPLAGPERVRVVLENGQLLFVKDGHTYDILGKRIK